jgi:hypothetical protein
VMSRAILSPFYAHLKRRRECPLLANSVEKLR